MKKSFIPFAAALLLGLSACGGPVTSSTGSPDPSSTPSSQTPSSEDPIVYSLAITNKAALAAEWHLGEANRTIELDCSPKVNLAQAIRDKTVTITSSNAAAVNVLGVHLVPLSVGTATITVKYGDKTDTVDVTVGESLQEPDYVVGKTLADVWNGADDTNGKHAYLLKAKVSSFSDSKGQAATAASQYGTMLLSLDGGATAFAYGASASTSALAYSLATKSYKFTNPKDFLTNEGTKGIKAGDELDVIAIRADYKTTKEVCIIVRAVNGTPVSNGNLTSDAIADFAYSNNSAKGLYVVTGKIANWATGKTDGTQYGNFYLKTEGDKRDDVFVYGASATPAALAMTAEGAWKLTNPKDFLTNEATKDLKIGDEITMLAYRADHKGAVQITGIIVPKVTPAEEPEPVSATIADLLAKTAPEHDKVYTVSGIWEAGKGDAYGNGYLTDAETGLSLRVYGATKTASALKFDGSSGSPVFTFTNPQDSAAWDVANGQLVTMKALNAYYTKTNSPQIQGIVTSNAAATATYTASVAPVENGNVVLSKTEGIAFGEEITVTATPAEGYKVDSMAVTDAQGIKHVIADGKFKATVVNKVEVTFALANEEVTSTIVYTAGTGGSQTKPDGSKVNDGTGQPLDAVDLKVTDGKGKFISSVDATNLYKNGYKGLKVSTGKNEGSLALTLDKAISKAEVTLAAYKKNLTAVDVNGSQILLDGSGSDGQYAVATLTFEGSVGVGEKLTIKALAKSTKVGEKSSDDLRFFISSIKLTVAD